MAFTFLPNIDVADFGLAILRIKTELKNAGWTVQDSGDGRDGSNIAHLYGNGADILSVSNTSGYQSNSINNIRCWFRIRSPQGLGGPEFIFTHSTFNPGTDSCGFIFIPKCVSNSLWSGAAADNYGTPPAGTVAIRVAAGASGPPSTASAFNAYGTTAQKLDMAIGGAAEGYAFYAFTRTAATRTWRGIFMDYCSELNPSDLHPHLFGVFSDSASTFWATGTGGRLDDGRTFWFPENGPEIPATTYVGIYGTSGDPATENVTQRLGGTGHPFARQCNGSYVGNDGGACGANPYNSNLDVFKGAWYYRSSHVEDFTARGGPAWPGLKGKSTLFHLGAGGATDFARATGQNLVAQGSGRFWVVCDSTVDFVDPGGASITAAVTVNIITAFDKTYAQMVMQPNFAHVADAKTTTFDPTLADIVSSYEVYINRVRDSVAGGFVQWSSTPLPDTTGVKYPGPGVFGVNTSDYCVEKRVVFRSP